MSPLPTREPSPAPTLGLVCRRRSPVLHAVHVAPAAPAARAHLGRRVSAAAGDQEGLTGWGGAPGVQSSPMPVRSCEQEFRGMADKRRGFRNFRQQWDDGSAVHRHRASRGTQQPGLRPVPTCRRWSLGTPLPPYPSFFLETGVKTHLQNLSFRLPGVGTLPASPGIPEPLRSPERGVGLPLSAQETAVREADTTREPVRVSGRLQCQLRPPGGITRASPNLPAQAAAPTRGVSWKCQPGQQKLGPEVTLQPPERPALKDLNPSLQTGVPRGPPSAPRPRAAFGERGRQGGASPEELGAIRCQERQKQLLRLSDGMKPVSGMDF